MIPFDWFRSRKSVLLNKEAALDIEIETLKVEERVLTKRDERDKLKVRVQARRLVRGGNGPTETTGTEAIGKAAPRRPVHKTVSTRKEAR